MNLHPFYECAKTANEQICKGNTIFQKWQCEHCQAEQHMETPNAFYVQGKCEECEKITDIEKNGCNYLLMVEGKNVLDYLEGRIAGDNSRARSRWPVNNQFTHSGLTKKN